MKVMKKKHFHIEKSQLKHDNSEKYHCICFPRLSLKDQQQTKYNLCFQKQCVIKVSLTFTKGKNTIASGFYIH